MKFTECTTLFGEKKSIPTNELTFRPSVYGVVINNSSVLTVKSRNTNKIMLPGGGIKIGEPIESALKREIKEETGIGINIISFLNFKESFFYYDPTNYAFQGYLFYYHCSPLSIDLAENEQVKDIEATSPQWQPISSLKPQDFHDHGELMLELIQTALRQSSIRD